MPRLFLETKIHADLETAWLVLLDRAENPGRYVAEVSEATITERLDLSFLQELQVHGRRVRQRVTVDKERRELRSQVLEHPLLTGEITTRIQPTSVQNPVAPLVLTILYDWNPTTEGEHKELDIQIRAQIGLELLALKERAEEWERSA